MMALGLEFVLVKGFPMLILTISCCNIDDVAATGAGRP